MIPNALHKPFYTVRCSCFFFVVVSEQPLLLGVSVEQSAIFKKLFGDQIQTAFFHVI